MPEAEGSGPPSRPQTRRAAGGSLPLPNGTGERNEDTLEPALVLEDPGSVRLMSPWQSHPCPAVCPGEGQLTGGAHETQNDVQKRNCTAPVFSRCPSFSHPCVPYLAPRVYCPLSMWPCCIPWSFLTLRKHFQKIKLFIHIYSIPSSLTASDPTSLTRGPAKDCRMWRRQAHSCYDTQTKAAKRAKGHGDPSL